MTNTVRDDNFPITAQRDDSWLLSRLDYLWSHHFAEVSQKNKVFIRFGKRAKYRFGSIRLVPEKKASLILINGMFRDPQVPVEVVDHTIAHELTHYSHGFSSPLKKMHQHPHRGGLIERELASRGLGNLVTNYKLWLKDYKKTLKPQIRIIRRRRRLRFRLKFI